MPTGEVQYNLEKKTLGRWSYVTWYPTYEEALTNFNNVTKGDTGYSWRIAKVETVAEKLLVDEPEVEAPKLDNPTVKVKWSEDTGKGWTSPQKEGWGEIPSPTREHGLSGSVWIGNPATKEKKRVPAAEADTLLTQGWIKAGPRTVL